MLSHCNSHHTHTYIRHVPRCNQHHTQTALPMCDVHCSAVFVIFMCECDVNYSVTPSNSDCSTQDSCPTYEKVMSHMWINHVPRPRVNKSCPTYEWVMNPLYEWGKSHTHIHIHTHLHTHIHTHIHIHIHIHMHIRIHIPRCQLHRSMRESCHIWIMSHIWMSHVPRMNESCHLYEWVMSHINTTLPATSRSDFSRANRVCPPWYWWKLCVCMYVCVMWVCFMCVRESVCVCLCLCRYACVCEREWYCFFLLFFVGAVVIHTNESQPTYEWALEHS